MRSLRWWASRSPHRAKWVKTSIRSPASKTRVDQLLEPGELARAALERSLVVVEVGGRVVADLLEGGDGRQHLALAGGGVVVVEARAQQIVEHGLVEADLLGRHAAVVELVDLVGQLGGDLGLGLGAAEHEQAVERPQGRLARGAAALAVGLDSCLTNADRGPTRPGLVKSRIDHRSPRPFSMGVPVSARREPGGEAPQLAGRPRWPGS